MVVDDSHRPTNCSLIEKFSVTYKRAVVDVVRFFNREKLTLIARHNVAWGPDRFDVGYYLSASELRYQRALSAAIANGFCFTSASSVLDIGGFFAALPLALARLGHNVTLAENYGFYYGAFDDLRNFLIEEGIKIWDDDLTRPIRIDKAQEFSLVTNMAVIEHLAGSPKALMENSRNLLKDDGLLLLEVPNMAYWPNRLKLLRGASVLPDLRDIYDSEEPFLGHHREYTIQDVQRLMDWANIEVKSLSTYNYTPWPRGNWKQKLLLQWPIARFKSCREVILACGCKRNRS